MGLGKTLTPTPHLLPLFLQNSHIFPFLKLGASWLYQVWSQEGFTFKTGLKIRPKMRYRKLKVIKLQIMQNNKTDQTDQTDQTNIPTR